MRPVKLSMTAFGPYAKEQVIDFSRLGGRNLFVITGNTGSGKTTILDAICFALYGKASGKDRDGESLRSHFANDDTLTSVELEFEISGTRYWVRRVPKQRKKRARGEGFTDHNAEAELKNLSDPSVEIISGIKEVNEKLLQIMGITYDQFKQIIMIPQGEFRELLTADSKMREDILQKIFGTEGFRQVQELLDSKAKSLSKDVDIIRSQLGENIRNIDASEYPELDALIKVPNVNAATVITETEKIIVMDNAKAEALELNIETQEKLIADKLKEIMKATQNNLKLTARDAAKKQYDELVLLKPQHEQKTVQLQYAREALSVVGVEDNLVSRVAELSRKQTALDNAQKEEQRLSVQVNNAEKKYQAELQKEDERKALLFEQSRLQELKGKVVEWDAKQQALVSLERQHAQVQTQREKTKLLQQKAKNRIAELQKELDNAKEAERQYAIKMVELEKIKNIYNKLTDLSEENAQLTSLRQTYMRLQKQETEARERFTKAQGDYDAAQAEFLAGQAGVLASQLKEGCPCPVCGSDHHPHPAILAENVPSEALIKSLLDEYKSCRQIYEQTKADFDRVRADGAAKKQVISKLLGDLSTAINEDITGLEKEQLTAYISAELPIWEARIKTFQAELKQLSNLKSKVNILADELTKTEAEVSRLDSEAARLDNDERELFGKVQGVRELLEGLAKELPADIRSTAALEKLIKGVVTRYETMKRALEAAEKNYTTAKLAHAQALAALSGAQAALEEAQAQVETAQQKFAEALKNAGFSDEAVYRKAKMTAGDIASLEKEISDYNEKLRSAYDSYVKAEHEVSGLKEIDVSILEAEQRQLETQKKQLLDAMTEVISRRNRNQSLLGNVCGLAEQLAKKEEEYQLIGHLARIAKGDNAQKLSFERYVLAAFFNDIIAAANIRLLKMTGGRYYMRRIAERGKGNAQSGLEIEVFDYYTGRARHVKTLSGGESFKASLALALGLADVVQSYSGGINIETMFIDEGFGTLDPESLDSAINTLVELQHSGRLVGIISHVPELKASVDARLEIEAHKDGSTATFYIM